MKLNKDEMKNVMGGQMLLMCQLSFTNGQVLSQSCTSMDCVNMWIGACLGDDSCGSASCS
jgi:hypothetical protein